MLFRFAESWFGDLTINAHRNVFLCIYVIKYEREAIHQPTVYQRILCIFYVSKCEGIKVCDFLIQMKLQLTINTIGLDVWGSSSDHTLFQGWSCFSQDNTVYVPRWHVTNR